MYEDTAREKEKRLLQELETVDKGIRNRRGNWAHDLEVQREQILYKLIHFRDFDFHE